MEHSDQEGATSSCSVGHSKLAAKFGEPIVANGHKAAVWVAVAFVVVFAVVIAVPSLLPPFGQFGFSETLEPLQKRQRFHRRQTILLAGSSVDKPTQKVAICVNFPANPIGKVTIKDFMFVARLALAFRLQKRQRLP
jgi:hypothetical protein